MNQNLQTKIANKKGAATFVIIISVLLIIIAILVGGIVTYLVKNGSFSNNGTANENNNTNTGNEAIKAELEKGYADLGEQLSMEYIDIEFEATIQGEKLSSVDTEKIAKCYTSAIDATSFIPVTETLSENNKKAVYKLEVSDEVLYVQIEVKADGSYALAKVENYVESENNELEAGTENNTSAGKEGYIYDAKYPYTVSQESYDTFYSTYHVKDIVVPYIDLDSEDAKKANNEIKGIFNKAIDAYKLGVDDKTTYVKMCEYTYTLNDNILSVVVTLGIGGTDVVRPQYYTYNFDVNTGKLLSYEDVYKLAGFNQESLFSGVNKIIRKNVNDFFINSIGETKNMDTYYAMSMNNYQKAVRQNTLGYYLDKNNKLNIVSDVAIPAGIGKSSKIMVVEYDKNFEIPQIMRIVYDNMTIPYINVDSDYAYESNNEIRQVLLKALKAQNEGNLNNSTTVKICDYKYTLNNEKLSVLVTLGIGGTDVVKSEYYTVNIDTKTGNVLTYEDVYKMTGFNADNIDAKAQAAITKVMQEKLSGVVIYPEGKDEDTYINASINNYKTTKQNGALKYYLDSNNKLIIIVTLEVPAGREYFDTVITLD